MAPRRRPSCLALIHWPTVTGVSALALLGIGGLVGRLTSATRHEARPTGPGPAVVSVPDTPRASALAEAMAFFRHHLAVPDAVMPRVEEPDPPLPPPAAPHLPGKEPVKPQGASAPVRAAVFKRRVLRSTDDLCRQLLTVPEINLETEPGTAPRLLSAARAQKDRATHQVPAFLTHRPDLAGLPMQRGFDCQLGKESAENLQVLSRRLRGYLAQALPGDGSDTRHNTSALRRMLLQAGAKDCCEWLVPEAVPTLVQLLQVEEKPVRLLLVELLGHIRGRTATAALAGRALFDLGEEVREAAVTALRPRPDDEYRPLLLQGLRYPWAPVADHAAEALVALADRPSISALVNLLDEPAPDRPAVHSGAGDVPVVRELVRVNHLRNCLLCHAPSFNANEPIRGRVPSRGQPLEPPQQAYCGTDLGTFVRADITYLRQDFSVPQPVADPGPWPLYQRYDYLVRTREATPFEVVFLSEKDSAYPQREAVLFALRELTGQDRGSASAGWRQLLLPGMTALKKQ